MLQLTVTAFKRIYSICHVLICGATEFFLRKFRNIFFNLNETLGQFFGEKKSNFRFKLQDLPTFFQNLITGLVNDT
jgi:hypothetical protein